MSGITKTIITWTTSNSFTTCTCYLKKIIPFSLQTNSIWKTIQFKLTNFHRVISTVHFYTYKTSCCNIQSRNIITFRQNNFRHHTKTIICNKLTVRIHFKRTITSISITSVIFLNTKITFTHNCHISIHTSILKRTLSHNTLSCTNFHTSSLLNTYRSNSIFSRRCTRKL